ncbi:MAG: antirestriction protein ArdA [Clostridia bacterium]|nr:antirestriction protein ArdA [Clostridia bacterium]
MITLNIKKDGEHVDIRFPCSEKVLTEALKTIGVTDEMDTKQIVSEVVDFESLSLLEGQEVDLDEINFLAKRLDSLTKPELDKFSVVAQMEGLDEPKDFINLTYNLNKYTLIQNIGDMTAVGRMHTLTRELAIPADDSRDAEYAKIGRELITSNKGKWTEKGLLFFNDDIPEETIYNGETFPEFDYDGNCLLGVAINFLNAEEYVYLPCGETAIKKALARLGVESTSHCKLRVDFDRIDNNRLAKLLFNSVEGEDIYDINNLAKELEDLTETDKFLAVVEYAETEDVKEMALIAQNLDEFEYVGNVDSDYEFGEYLVDNDDEYECSENLRDFINYKELGEQVRRNGHGMFVRGGFVYIPSGRQLEDIIDKDMGMSFGGM